MQVSSVTMKYKSKTEEEIQQAIRPCIEKMVIDVTNDQPKDVVKFI